MRILIFWGALQQSLGSNGQGDLNSRKRTCVICCWRLNNFVDGVVDVGVVAVVLADATLIAVVDVEVVVADCCCCCCWGVG